MVGVRVTRSAVEALYDSLAPVRITRQQANVVYADRTYPVRVTRVQAQAVYNDRTYPIRVTAFLAQVLHSVAERSPGPDPLIRPPAIIRARVPTKEREINPYRATAPLGLDKKDPQLYDYLREQGEHLRAQHNVNQAGDSTFPWEQLTKVGDIRAYSPGSLGRFYHDDYGIIMARYVQFKHMMPGEFINGPAGRLKDSTSVDWTVTNNYDLSGPDLVKGVISALDMPKDDQWGWLIVQGANISELPKLGVDDVPKVNAELTWGGHESVAVGGTGRPFARVWTPTVSQGLVPGAAYIDVEGTSTGAVKEAIAPDLAVITEANAALDSRVATIESMVSPENAQASDSRVAKIEQDLATEIQRRIIDVKALGKRIDAGFSGASKADLALVTQMYKEADTILSTQIKAAAAKGQLALDRLDGLNFATIDAAIQQLQITIKNLIPLILIPLVVGFPPVLVYDEGGSLILVETPSG